VPVSAEPRGRHVLLGACGSVAAMATPVLVRRLRDRLPACEVRICATDAGRRMIDLGGLACDSDVTSAWSASGGPPAPDHVTLAAWADVVVVAPATANTIGQVAHGLAPNLLTTVLLAASCPTVYAPVMNAAMWSSPAVRRNVRTLRRDGAVVLVPRAGISLALGRTEFGSMADPVPILQSLLERSLVA
jgi:phosphopantothenoylcysteine synthetase/decarboxylase